MASNPDTGPLTRTRRAVGFGYRMAVMRRAGPAPLSRQSLSDLVIREWRVYGPAIHSAQASGGSGDVLSRFHPVVRPPVKFVTSSQRVAYASAVALRVQCFLLLGLFPLLFSPLVHSSPAQVFMGGMRNHVVTQENAEQFGLSLVMTSYDKTAKTYKVRFVSEKPARATLFIMRPEYEESYAAARSPFFEAIASEWILMSLSLNQYTAYDGRFFREFELRRESAAYAYIYIAPSLPRRFDPSCEADSFLGLLACGRYVFDDGMGNRYLLRMADFLPVEEE